MLEGRLIQAGKPDPFNLKDGVPVTVSSATAYCWFVWLHGENETRLHWIPKCRTRLESEGDYPDYSAELAALKVAAPLPLFGEAHG